MESGTVEQTLAGARRTRAPQRRARSLGRAIGLTPNKRLMLVSGRSNPDLAAADRAAQIGCELGEMTLKTFASGETYCRYEDSIRGADIFIVQTASMPVDQHLMELLIMINAAKLASAKRITAVIPWYFYVRQDKKSRPREPITAKLVADLLQTAGADRVLTMDLHAGQVQGFFEIPVDHMTAIPMFAQYVRDLNLGEELAVVSPDTGHAKIAGKFAEMVAGDLVILNKVRPAHNEAKVTTVIGDVEGKVAVIIDDIIDTAGTLVAGATALKDAGATKVYACATHGLFNGQALERIAASEIHKLVVTDTVPLDPLAATGQHPGAVDRRHPRRDDLERVRRRLGVGDLRRREPAVLTRSSRRTDEHCLHARSSSCNNRMFATPGDSCAASCIGILVGVRRSWDVPTAPPESAAGLGVVVGADRDGAELPLLAGRASAVPGEPEWRPGRPRRPHPSSPEGCGLRPPARPLSGGDRSRSVARGVRAFATLRRRVRGQNHTRGQGARRRSARHPQRRSACGARG